MAAGTNAAARVVECDLLVVGSGAAGMTAAITARQAGLSVIVAEKSDRFGGASALSGGTLWVPDNPVARREGMADSLDAARTYLRHELGNHYDEERLDAFLDLGPRMVSFLEKHSHVRFIAPRYPDYHPDVEGASPAGRALRAAPYDGRLLGRHLRLLRMPIPQMMLWGRISIAPEDMPHVFAMSRSARSALHVAALAARGGAESLVWRRGIRLTTGNALMARLARTLLDREIPLWLDAPVTGLDVEAGRVVGATVAGTAPATVRARRGVLLATGGFSADEAMRNLYFAHARKGHLSLAPDIVAGDGVRLGLAAGGVIDADMAHAGALVPLSLVPRRDGPPVPFPHLVDRAKPGFIAVDARGERFTDESASYHDFVAAMVESGRDRDTISVHLVADHRAVRRYGMGAARPFPVPLSPWLRSGYLVRARTLEELAGRIGVDPARLQATVAAYNRDAAEGVDRRFGRGSTLYTRFMGDAAHEPNPCIAPLEDAPFYAVRIHAGDLGTMAGLRTDRHARVLDAAGAPTAGLYAAGNDMASVMGGHYPGAGVTLGPGMAFGYGAALHAAGLKDLQ